MRVLTAAQTRAAEQAAAKAGTSLEALMENAGAAAAREIAALAARRRLDQTALLLCGRGNNAGDAFVAARLLAGQGWRCRCLLLCGDEFSPLARLNYTRLPAGVETGGPGAAAGFDAAALIDGVFGIGFHGALPALASEAFQTAGAPLRVALDVPSGLDCDTGATAAGTFRADVTLAFAALKPGLLRAEARAYTGVVRCLDIGM